jgi:hypothetical protein
VIHATSTCTSESAWVLILVSRNGYRVRLWRVQLQKRADEMQMAIQICHFPPGPSKWSTIEHRMFCYIIHNWRGCPLVSREVVVNLIGSTTTESGLHIQSQLDENRLRGRHQGVRPGARAARHRAR